MEFRILGPLQVFDGEAPVEVAGAKRRAVLALLLLHANEVVRTERLIDELWGEHAPRNAAAALHSHVSRLRKALGAEVLARREWGYVLRAEPDSIDLHRFERLVAAAEPLPAHERSAKLTEALRLWRGPALLDLAHEAGLQTEIARLDELRLTTLERRIDADLEAGRNAQLVGEIETLIAAHPLREHLRWQLILALYRAGRQAEALEVYRETRRVLTEELGLEPSPELKELEKAILRQDPAIAAVAPLSTPSGQPARLSKRRTVMLTLLALGAAGLGVGAALAVIDFTGSHHSFRATPAAATTNAAATTAGATTRARPPRASREVRSREQVRRRRAAAASSLANGRTTNRTSTHAAAKSPRRASSSVADGRTTNRTSTHPAARNPRRASKPPPPPKPVIVSDSFDADYVDPTIWHEVKDGGDVSILERDGQLQLTVGAGAVPGGTYNQIDVHVGTQCSFPGNFDARVDFALLEWPAGDNIDVGLNAIYANAAVMRESSTQWGDEYASWAIPGNGSVALPDVSGSLRIARVNGTETTYFWHQGRWRKLASSAETGAAVLGLQAMSDGNNAFGGQELEVAFDNFKVTGIAPVCRG